MRLRPLSRSRASWRIRCVWLVACALLWGWLAAPLVQAMSPPGGGWVQVCTSLGTKLVQLDQGDTSSQGDKPTTSAASATDCPYCRLHVSPALVPTPTRIPQLPGPISTAPLTPAVRAAPPDPPWRPAWPRAPPRTTFA